MSIPCRRCRTLNAWNGGGTLVCALCGCRNEITPAQQRRAERERRLEERRQALLPVNLWASVAVIGLTLLLVLGLFGRHWTGTPFGEVSFWAFPVWSTLLFTTAIFLARHDREDLFPLLRKSMAVTLVALMLPMAWEALPRELRAGRWAHVPEIRLSHR